jgi:hypothetical protein
MERNTDGTLKKGHSGLKPKGAISEKTKVWNEISDWFKNEGLEAYQEKLMEMQENEPKEFLKRYEAMLEYFAPKLSRTEIKGEMDISKSEKLKEILPDEDSMEE